MSNLCVLIVSCSSVCFLCIPLILICSILSLFVLFCVVGCIVLSVFVGAGGGWGVFGAG